MLITPTHHRLNLNNEVDAFTHLLKNLQRSVKTWDFFVNWNKVHAGICDFQMELNALNVIIGADDPALALRGVLEKLPHAIAILPVMIACRDGSIDMLVDISHELKCKNYDFTFKKALKDDQINNAIEFMSKSGFLELVKQKKIKSIPDYVLGVEVGLDSNGRKNRSGTVMESIVEGYLKALCETHKWEYIPQATPHVIKRLWGHDVTVLDAIRSFDFAVLAKGKLTLIETNVYNGGGSKLKATAGEYKDLHGVLVKQGHKMVWVTDGAGWLTAAKPLQDAYNKMNYIFNLKQCAEGCLSDAIKA